MGSIAIEQWRCTIGTFNGRIIKRAGNKTAAVNSTTVLTFITFLLSFPLSLGCINVTRMLLVMAGVERNPGPPGYHTPEFRCQGSQEDHGSLVKRPDNLCIACRKWLVGVLHYKCKQCPMFLLCRACSTKSFVSFDFESADGFLLQRIFNS